MIARLTTRDCQYIDEFGPVSEPWISLVNGVTWPAHQTSLSRRLAHHINSKVLWLPSDYRGFKYLGKVGSPRTPNISQHDGQAVSVPINTQIKDVNEPLSPRHRLRGATREGVLVYVGAYLTVIQSSKPIYPSSWEVISVSDYLSGLIMQKCKTMSDASYLVSWTHIGCFTVWSARRHILSYVSVERPVAKDVASVLSPRATPLL